MLKPQLLASAMTNLQLLPFFSKKSTSWFPSESGMELVSSVSQGSISTGCISVISRSAVDSMGPTAKWRDWRMTYDWVRWISRWNPIENHWTKWRQNDNKLLKSREKFKWKDCIDIDCFSGSVIHSSLLGPQDIRVIWALRCWWKCLLMVAKGPSSYILYSLFISKKM